MINPNLIEASYKRFKHPKLPSGKAYIAVIGRNRRGLFKTASAALEYAQRVHARWIRLYDAAIVAMNQSEVVQ